MTDPSIQFEVDWADEGPSVYANGAAVVANLRDVCVAFHEFQDLPGRGGAPAGHLPKAKIVATVRMTPEAFFDVVTTLASSWNRMVKEHGDPRERTPKFKLIGSTRQLEGLD